MKPTVIGDSMSAIASFYLLTNAELDGLRKVVQKFPSNRHTKDAIRVPQNVKEAKLQKPAVSLYSSVGDYLNEYGKQPYHFNWSGWVIGILLEYLKDQKQIDLTESTFDTGDDSWIYYLFDINTRHKYLHLLQRDQFSENELKNYLNSECNEDVPTAGEAMLEGIHILQQYLSLITSESVVLLHVG